MRAVLWAVLCASLALLVFIREPSLSNVLLIIPIVITALFYLFKNEQCPQAQSSSFFSNFIVGGHRGSPWKQAENSIASFNECKKEGCQLVEFDVELTKDNVLIVMHDDTTNRTTDQEWLLRERSFEEVKGLKLKFIPRNGGPPVFDGEVPTLNETVLWCMDNNMKMLFDVKQFDNVVVDTISLLFEKYNLYERGIVSSFNPLVPYFVKRKNPKILTGYTWARFCYSTQREGSNLPKVSNLWNLSLELYDAVNCMLITNFLVTKFLGIEMLLTNHRDICHTLVFQAQYHNIQVVSWTSNDPIEAKWMQEYLKIPFLTDSPESIGYRSAKPITPRSVKARSRAMSGRVVSPAA